MLRIILKYGLIGGLISVLSLAVSYTFGTAFLQNYLLSSLIQLVFFVALIATGVMAAKEFRKINEGIINFKEAFIASIGSFIVLAVITSIFSILLYNVIDKDYAEKTKLAVLEKMEENLDKQNISDDQKTVIIESVENRDFSYKPVKTFGIYIGVSALIALIIAASIKKDINETTQSI